MAETEKTKSDNVFKVTEYLSYVGPIIIFLGMARLITFYKAFGVSIVSYLDFSEVITSFFDIIFIVFLFFAYTSIQNFVLGDKNQAEEADKQRQEIIKEESFKKLFWLYIKYFKRLLIFGFIAILVCVLSHYIFKSIDGFTVFLIIGLFIFLIIFFIVIVEIERKHIHFQSSLNRRRFIYLTLYFLVFTMGVVYYSSYQAGLIKRDKSTYGVAITLDNDKILVSDSLNYFIGKTLNYVFIYHEKLKSTDIIPMTRVKQITTANHQNTRK